jgi:hypothetical protein
VPQDFHLLYRDPYNRRLYVANPSSTLNQWVSGSFDPDPTARSANLQDIMKALDQTDVEFLDLLKAAGYTDRQVTEIGEMWGCEKKALKAFQSAEDNEEIDHAENYYLTKLAGAMMNQITEAHGAVSTPAILGASLKDLRLAEESYDAMLRQKHAEMLAIQETIESGNYYTNTTWCEAYALFHKWSGYLWETRTRLNVNVFTGEVGEVSATPKTD